MQLQNKPRLYHLVTKHITPSYDKEGFKDYLDKIFMSISIPASDTSNILICPKIVFHKILQFPLIISNHLHDALMNKSSGLDKTNWIHGLTKLYHGTFDQMLMIIFSMCDCSHKGIIVQEDIVLLLKHFHYYHYSHVKGTIGSFDIIRRIIGLLFKKKLVLTLEELKIQLAHNSDFMMLFMIFFVNYKPFHEDSIAFLQARKSVSKEQVSDNLKDKKAVSDSQNELILGECSEELFIYFNNRFNNQYEYKELLRKTSSSSIDELDKFEEDIRDLITDSSSQEDMYNNKIKNDSMILNHRPSFRLNNSELLIKQSKWSTQSLTTVATTLPKVIHSPSKFNTKIQETVNLTNLPLNNSPMNTTIIPTNSSSTNMIDVINKIKGVIEKMSLCIINKDLFILQQDKVIEIINMKNYFISHEMSDCFSKRNIYSIVLTPYYGIYLPIRTFISQDLPKLTAFVQEAHKILKQRVIKDEYELIEEIWKGDYSYIFKACQISQPDKIVVVKILTKRNIDSTHLEMIETEVEIYRLLQRCQHKNIIKSIDLFESANNYYIINEYIPDGTLDNYLTIKTNLQMENFNGLIKQIIKSIHFIHSFGIVHRDLKAANILLLKNREKHQIVLKLNDFGLSKIICFSEKAIEPCGSLCYTAPEIILSKPYNHQVDIWSLGVLAYFIWYHQFPFYDEENLDVISEKIIKSKFTFPSKKLSSPTTSGTVCAQNQLDDSNIQHFISLCLTHEPTKRVSIEDILTI